MFQVGESVRVVSLDGKTARKAMVATTEAQTVDVEYDDGECEDSVSLNRCSRLLDFENSVNLSDVRTFVSQAQQLTTCLDFAAAIEQLQRAIDLLANPNLSCGSVVLVPLGNGQMTVGTVASTDDSGLCDCFLDDDRELDNIPLKHLIPLPPSGDQLVKFVRILIEMSSLAIRGGLLPNAVVYTSRALDSIVALEVSSQLEPSVDANTAMRKLRFKALMLRSRAHLMQHHFRFAAIDIKQAVVLDPSDKAARKMVEAIKQRKALEAKKNARLARNVSEWVEKAVQVGSQ